MLRLFRARSLAFQQGAASTPVKTQVWDQFMTWGTKRKAGQDSVFDETTLGQIVNNFRARTNLIGMDYEHQTASASENGAPAPQLAFYNALAIVRNGKVIDFATRDESVQPPAVTPQTSDGLYGYRCEVTPLGQQLLPNYKYLSPFFDVDGADEQERPIGYDLMNVSAVSVPFQDGCEITFQRLGAKPRKFAKGKKMEELRKFLGLDDDATMDDVYSACLKRFKKYDDDGAAMKKKFDDDVAAMKKKFDDDAAAMAKKYDDATPEGIMADDDDGASAMDDDMQFDVDPSNAAQNAAVHIKTGNVHDEGGRKKSKLSALRKMARVLGLSGVTTPAKMAAALSAKMVPMADVTKIRQELDAFKAEREEEKKAEREKIYAALADKALVAGYDKTKRDSLIAFARADLKAAEEFVASLPKTQAMKRITNGGGPIGKEPTERENFDTPIGSVEDDDAKVDAAVRAYMKGHKVDYATALTRSPEAARLYRRAAR